MGDPPGKTGRWQVALLLAVGCNYAIVSVNHVLPAFHAFTPPFFCQVEKDETGNTTRVEGCLPADQECPEGYRFESPRNETTIVTEWGLVCGLRFLKPLVATVYYCGVTLGAPLGGWLADRHGRRLVMLVSLYCQGALGLALYAVDTLAVFTAVRAIQGVFVQSLQGSTYTLLMELFPPTARTAVGIVAEIYWALGLCVLAGSSYWIPDWRTLQLALTVPTLFTVMFVCFIPESPRWLATRGRHVEAERVLRKIARLNGHCKKRKDGTKVSYTYGKLPILCGSPKNGIEMNGLSNIDYQSSTIDAVTPSLGTKEEKRMPLSVSQTATCFKDVLGDTNLTAQERDTASTPSSPSAQIAPWTESPTTKQDAATIANCVGTDMRVEVVAAAQANRGVLDLFRNTLMRKYSGLMIYIWFSVSLCYYGIIFYLPDLSGDRHLNFFLGAVLEAVSYCLSYFVLTRLGRRYPLMVYLLLSGILCASVGILGSLQTRASVVQTVLAQVGKGAVVSAFCTIFIYTTELFPTVVRAASFGCCAFGGRVGNLLAPQLLLLGEFTTNVVPLVIMGSLAMLAGLGTLLLPETMGQPLPDTVQQAEDIHKTRAVR